MASLQRKSQHARLTHLSNECMFLHENNTASDEYDRKGEQYNLIYLFIYLFTLTHRRVRVDEQLWCTVWSVFAHNSS